MKKAYLTIGFLLTALQAPAAHASLAEVDSWGIQRQMIDVEEVASAEHDLVVIEYSPSGSDQNRFTAADIARMKQNGKKVLAYLSIGKAESFRFYWNSAWEVPRQENCHETYYDTFQKRYTWRNVCAKGNFELIGNKDPNWDGRYEVRYWKREWWADAISPYLDRIFEAGFDGVYLAGINAYEYWGEQEGSKQVLADEMALLAYRVAIVSRLKMGDDFLVIPQNGMRLVRDASAKWKRLYFKVIDAIALESYFFDTSNWEKQLRQSLVQEFYWRNKPVFVVEYTKEKYLPRLWKRIRDYEEKSGISVIPYRSTNDGGLYRLLPPMKK